MKKLFVFLTFIAFSYLNSNAQWSQVTGTTGYLINNMVARGDTIFVGTIMNSGTGIGNGVNLISFNGFNWDSSPIGLTSYTITALASDDNQIFASRYTYYVSPGSYQGIYRSANNGGNWTAVNYGLPMNGNNDYPDVHALAIKGNNIYAGTSIGKLYWSPNNGNNWALSGTGLSTNSISGIITSNDSIFICNDDGVYYSTNNGSTCTKFTNGCPNTTFFSIVKKGPTIFAGTTVGVYYLPNSSGSWIAANNGLNVTIKALATWGNYIFVGTQGNGVFLSYNNGANWYGWSYGLPSNSIISSLAVTSNYIFAGTSTNGVWVCPLAQITGIKEEMIFTMSVYPNPATTTLNVYGLSASATAEVFNMNGKILLIKQLNIPQLDITSLAKGLYFLKLTTPEGSVVRKFVKE
ncbi:MAG: T9SS type A sorting domain-containing protein [Bacteroidota bacterium]